ncbi:TonB-dependent receptor plug domain-containing protein [Alteromonas facilis]|uniref:TonB-dependent receptor plug domain-containing protein n=1 Tax=Alteromonas facilis TaxID=2048004 RepID=UPI000C28985A|nr:TonB-dependent receptor [Alteromonas facilis]
MTRKTALACLIVASTFSARGAMAAQSYFDLSLEDLLKIKVSIASKTQESQLLAPASISVYSREELQSMGIQNLDQLLNFVPGFTSSREDSARVNATSVRGRRINSNAPDVLVMLDGSRLNDPVTSGAFYSSAEFSLFNIKQVEIIRGPSSALYGSNAFSAVINLISEPMNEAQFEVGDFGHRNIQLAYSNQVMGSDINVYLAHQEDEGDDYAPFFPFFGEQNPTQDPQFGSNVHITLKRGNWAFSSYWNQRSFQDFIIGGTQGDGVNEFYRSGWLTSLKYSNSDSDVLHYASSLEYYKVEQDALITFYPASIANQVGWTDGSNIDLLGGNVRDGEEYRFSASGLWFWTENQEISFGFEYRQEQTGLNAFQSNIDVVQQRDSGGTIVVPSEKGLTTGFYVAGGARLDLIKPFDRDIWGAYVQDKIALSDNTEITLGLRYDKYQTLSDNVSLRAGLVTTFDEHSTIKVLYSEAFRAPTIVDTQAEISSVEVGNPDLEPELISTLDLVYVYQLENLSLSTNVFYSQVDNEIVVELRTIFEGFNSLQPVNNGQLDLSGIEWELLAELSERVYLRAGASYYDRHQALGAARWHGYAALNMEFEPITVNINTEIRDDVISSPDGSTFIDGYALTNINAKYSISENAAVVFNVTNLFDKAYATYTTGAGLTDGLPGRGRQWKLSYRHRF